MHLSEHPSHLNRDITFKDPNDPDHECEQSVKKVSGFNPSYEVEDKSEEPDKDQQHSTELHEHSGCNVSQPAGPKEKGSTKVARCIRRPDSSVAAANNKNNEDDRGLGAPF